MAVSLVRSRAMITRAIDRHRWEEIADGAVLQEDGVILELGTCESLKARHPDVPVIGTGNEILLPGFVNGHHHIGHHHGAAHPWLDAGQVRRGGGALRARDPRLRGYRHAGFVLLRGARPE